MPCCRYTVWVITFELIRATAIGCKVKKWSIDLTKTLYSYCFTSLLYQFTLRKNISTCMKCKITERKVKTLTKNWRDHGRQAHKNTRKQNWNILTDMAIFLNQKKARKMAMSVEIFRLCFRVPVHCEFFNFG